MDKNSELMRNIKLIINFFGNKKVQIILLIILLLGVILLGTLIRLQPVLKGNLVDQTTGKYLPLALDPFYFLRVAETILDTGGNLPEYDEMRSPHLNIPWTKETIADSIVVMYKISSIFSSKVSLEFIDVIYPVIFFVLGLIIFFILIFILTKNKWVALISSLILTIIPPYLYRTLAGFSDHEAIGIFGIFLALGTFAYGLFYLDKKKPNILKTGIIGIISGFFTMFSIASWGGGGKFVFMILPLAFFARWFTKKEKILENNISFYGSWILGIILGALIFNYTINELLRGYFLSISGMLAPFTLIFIVVEYAIIKRKILKEKFKKYLGILTLLISVIAGLIFYQIAVGDVLALITMFFKTIIYPFGTDRVSLTVAENAQPYLSDLISQIGKGMFYVFLLGAFLIGVKISKGIKKAKLRPLFYLTFIFFIIGILFSRFSSSSVFNGNGALSKGLFLISFLAFALSTIYIFFKSEWKIKTKWIFIAAWMIPMLLSVRSAVRVFFAIVPFISFLIAWVAFEIPRYAKKSKDEITKFFLIIISLLVIGIILFSSFSYYKDVTIQAKNQSPSANADWQKAMEWVRDNTGKEDIFLHWWDYGYWVQTLGERKTFSDGGHPQAGFGDHLVGRYVLTTPYPETAKSFMKTHNISYLLIDPTDIGKYSAYSSIGDDLENSDRASFLATFLSNPSEIQETREGQIRVYKGGINLDSDIIYEKENETIFLAKENSYLGGVILEKKGENYSQPLGVFITNGRQHYIPLRYLFFEGELKDFREGINSTIYVYPNIYSSQEGQKFDLEGAIIYLSEKTKDSLVAKLYLMNDPLKEYSELELVYEDYIYPFNFYYQGFRGPIRIWEVNVEKMQSIIPHDEFKNTSGEYGEMDGFKFIE